MQMTRIAAYDNSPHCGVYYICPLQRYEKKRINGHTSLNSVLGALQFVIFKLLPHCFLRIPYPSLYHKCLCSISMLYRHLWLIQTCFVLMRNRERRIHTQSWRPVVFGNMKLSAWVCILLLLAYGAPLPFILSPPAGCLPSRFPPV